MIEENKMGNIETLGKLYTQDYLNLKYDIEKLENNCGKV